MNVSQDGPSAPGPGPRPILFGQHPADHILVDLHAEGSPDDECNLPTPESVFAALQLKDHADEFLRRPFGAGLAHPA